MSNFQEKEKNLARKLVLNEAVIALTINREQSTIASRDYVRDAYKYLTLDSWMREAFYSFSEKSIDRWENFYDSISQAKKARDLKVAYLSGPSPSNDLRVLTSLGILPENIWAFEDDKDAYNSAIWETLNSDFPFLKIIKGNIAQFLSASPQKFDIIYLDFCGPLPSRSQKTLEVITEILSHHSINSPGVLITNLALPNKDQNERDFDFLSKLVASYLYPKPYLEADSFSEGDFQEGPIPNEVNFDEWLCKVKENLDFYYSNYISRLVMDLASIIVPFSNFPQKSGFFDRLFNLDKKQDLSNVIDNIYHTSVDESHGHVCIEPTVAPILWTVASLCKSRNKKDICYPQMIYENPEYGSFCDSFLRQIGLSKLENFERVYFLVSEMPENLRLNKFYSEILKEISRINWSRKMYNFCDIVLFNQIKELIFFQMAIPYYVNVKKTKRWTYKAKTTRMFMDMFVLDECRYIYDWMPTIDMMKSGLGSIDRQFCYRFALDALSKNRHWYNQEYFYGTAVIGIWGMDKFDAGVLSKRIEIN